MNNPLVELLKRTPGVILAGEALEDLAEDIQAEIIKQLANSPYLPKPQADPLEDMQREFANALEDLSVSEFGVTVHNLIAVADYPGRVELTPAQRKAVVEVVLGTLLIESQAAAFLG